MKSIRLENVTKSYDGEPVLENVNLTIPSGNFFALLGPSGSGKTTILRLIAGFETVDSGRIFLGEQDITHIPINERPINTVFQQYALFPHMNVFENVAYPLTIRKVKQDIINQKVHKILKAVHLEKHIYKPIKQLSGGQKQRVALARAIINDPEVLLLDEPLAALDVKLREKLLIELIDLQDAFKTTFVYVTHDQFEALTVADHMAIMNYDGEIEQVGTPEEIYEFPVSSYVAKFVGNTNIVKGVLHLHEHDDKNASLEIKDLGNFNIRLPKKRKDWIKDGNTVFMSLRPEKIELSKSELTGFSNRWRGIIEDIIYYGRSTQYTVRLKNNLLIQVFEQNEEHFPKEVIDYNDEVNLYWQKDNMVLLEK